MVQLSDVHRTIQGKVQEFVSHPGVWWFGVGSVTTLLVTFVTLTLGWKEYLVFNLVTVGIVVVLVMRYLEDRGVVRLTPCQCQCHETSTSSGSDRDPDADVDVGKA